MLRPSDTKRTLRVVLVAGFWLTSYQGFFMSSKPLLSGLLWRIAFSIAVLLALISIVYAVILLVSTLNTGIVI
jgi:hypothetical protein